MSKSDTRQRNMTMWKWRMHDRGKDGKVVHYYLTVRAFTVKEARNVFKYHGFVGGRLKKIRPRGY